MLNWRLAIYNKLGGQMRQQLQAYVRNLVKDVDQLLDMNTILQEDIQQLLNAFDDNWSNQAFRRIVVRTCWAHIEAVVFGIKQMTLTASVLGSEEMEAEEQRFLAETVFLVDSLGQAKVSAKRFDTKKNIKRVLNLAAKRFDTGWSPGFDCNHWDLMTRSLELRHRLTHPKSREQLHISDAEIEEHREAFLWFFGMFTALLEGLRTKYVQPA